MKDNLENISFEEVANPDGINYATFRKNLKPAYRKAITDIIKGYSFLILALTTITILIKSGLFTTIMIFPAALVIGYILAYLHLFIHAAAHYNLHPVKYINDRISDYAIGIFFWIQQKKYRKIHWMHHANLGTKDDTEHSYFNELNIAFLVKCITGIHTFSVIVSRRKRNNPSEKNSPSAIVFGLWTFLFHLALLTLLFLLGGWKLMAAWLIGLAIVFPSLATIRQLLEHRGLHASRKTNYKKTDHGKVSRLFGKGIIDSSFGAAGFNRHLLHHWDPSVSYTSLPDIEDYLSNCPETSNIIKESKTSYWKTFIALFKI
jgi:fatty acid desaturase